MNTTDHSTQPVIESRPSKHLITAKKGLPLAVFVVIPQLGLQLAYHVGSKDDLLGAATITGILASFLGYFLRELWHDYEKMRRLRQHFQHRTETVYIQIRGLAFSHGFIVSREIEEFVCSALPSAEE